MRLSLMLILLTLLQTLANAGEERIRVAHIYVALCDNANQGIAPVPAHLGNGQDPNGNLYWGARYGVRTFFSQAPGWRVIRKSAHPTRQEILERLVFYHAELRLWLVADAYDGRAIKTAIRDMLDPPDTDVVKNIGAGGTTLYVGRHADLRGYVGHNGLMEFKLGVPETSAKRKTATPVIVLACKSRPFFERHLRARQLSGLLLTEGLMAPEAYTLDAALRAWIHDTAVPDAAAKAYAKYQQISQPAASRLFSSLPAEPESTRASQQATPTTRMVSSLTAPAGYTRPTWPASSFATHVEQLPVKAPGSPVHSWRGDVVREGDSVLAVIDWPRPSRVQQCADVAIRLYANWCRENGKPVSFRSLSNDEIVWNRWLHGRYGLNASGSRIQFTPGASRRKTDKEFEAYLRFVMTYANSASLARDLPRVKESALRPGDLYIQPDPQGGIGHASVLLSVCQTADTERLFLFGYGFIPAQDFHLPKPISGEGKEGWFTLKGFKHHVRQFGTGAFHRFP